MRYCGRTFSVQELELIRSLMAEHPGHHRLALSRLVCEHLDWRRPNGGLKDMSCRVAMLRMHRDGLIQLPPPQQACYNGRLRRRRTPQAEPQLPITGSLQGLSELHLRPVAKGAEAALWREYVDRYHYLGYTPLAGAQLRYLVRSGPQVLAVLGFAACAWKVAPRDQFIGWSAAQREARLQLVVNNARFLILPWVQVKNLASWVLARSCRRLPEAGTAATATVPCCWRPSSSPIGSSAPATVPPIGSTSGKPKAAANSMSTTNTLCPRRTSGSIRSAGISAAAFAPRSILTPTSRPNIYS